MCPYPDATGPNDPNAPWNATEPEECRECGGIWTDDGHVPVSETIYVCVCGYEWQINDPDEPPHECPDCGDEDIRRLPCHNEGQNMADFEEMERATNAEMQIDEQRLKG